MTLNGGGSIKGSTVSFWSPKFFNFVVVLDSSKLHGMNEDNDSAVDKVVNMAQGTRDEQGLGETAGQLCNSSFRSQKRYDPENSLRNLEEKKTHHTVPISSPMQKLSFRTPNTARSKVDSGDSSCQTLMSSYPLERMDAKKRKKARFGRWSGSPLLTQARSSPCRMRHDAGCSPLKLPRSSTTTSSSHLNIQPFLLPNPSAAMEANQPAPCSSSKSPSSSARRTSPCTKSDKSRPDAVPKNEHRYKRAERPHHTRLSSVLESFATTCFQMNSADADDGEGGSPTQGETGRRFFFESTNPKSAVEELLKLRCRKGVSDPMCRSSAKEENVSRDDSQPTALSPQYKLVIGPPSSSALESLQERKVHFPAEPVTQVKYRPYTRPEDKEKLYFGDTELEKWQEDRLTCLGDRFELLLTGRHVEQGETSLHPNGDGVSVAYRSRPRECQKRGLQPPVTPSVDHSLSLSLTMSSDLSALSE